MVESRYRMGLVSYLDLIEAKGNLSEAEALLPLLYQNLYDTQQRLALLTGQYPTTYPENSHDKNYFNLLEPVPPGLPSELLLRRPDIRAAEARINRMYEMLKSARASRFPSITLTGSYGWASTSLSNLFRPENELWQIASGILEPIFDAGKLKKEEQEALSRYREALIFYSKTVLNAFYEVENALLNRKLLLERRNQLLKVLENAKTEEKTSTAQYIRGLTDLLSVLRAKDRRFAAEESLIDVETLILLNRVSLYRALGGGWQSLNKKGVKRNG
jgi:multidrug efflux system outer membrane protein